MCYLEEPQTLSGNVGAGNRDEYFQSYLSNWVLRYDENDSAKNHFQVQLISNGKF